MIRSLVLHALLGPLALAGVAHATCDSRIFTRRAGLASPKLVDPEDERAILNFIDAVAPFARDSAPGALEGSLKVMWARYRPDLSAEDIAARLMPTLPSRLALLTLRTKSEPARRAEVGRLRLTWMHFLEDALPGAAVVDPAVVHRARILALRQQLRSVCLLLTETAGHDVRVADDSFARALRHLYQTYLPDHGVPDLHLAAGDPKERERLMMAQWHAYVDQSTTLRPIENGESEVDVDPLSHPLALPDNARAMMAYLVQRYPSIRARNPRAMSLYVQALRTEYGLGPTKIAIPPGVITGIGGRREIQPPAALRDVWRELARDLNKKDKLVKVVAP